MTDAMEILFRYASEHLTNAYLPVSHDHFCGAYPETLETALTDTFSDAQKALWTQWQREQFKYNLLWEKAIFQAAFDLRRELG